MTSPKNDDTGSIMLDSSSSAVNQGIDDLLGLSDGSNARGGGMNMSEFMLNNTSPALASLGSSSTNTMNNGMSDKNLLGSDSTLPTTDDLLFGNMANPSSSDSDGSSFTETWNKMFGNMQQPDQPSNDKLDSPTKYMPSDLLDSFASLDPCSSSRALILWSRVPPAQQATGGLAPTGLVEPNPPAPTGQQAGARRPASEPTDGNLSTWLNLFSDLDPLSNPDAIGKDSKFNQCCGEL